MHILLVEAEPTTTRHIERLLEQDGHLVESTDLGEDAQDTITLFDFDIAIVSRDLPDVHGCVLVHRLRAANIGVPILMLSSVNDREDKVRAFTNGADDFMLKPFDTDEFKARLHAIVRRAKGHAQPKIQVGRMVLDTTERSVAIDGQALNVTGKEYRLLEALALRKGKTMSKESLLDHLYGGRDEPEQKIIDVFICKLRKKIAAVGGSDHGIETVWGNGYMLKDQAHPSNGLAEDHIEFAHQASVVSELDLLLLQLMA